MSKQPQQNDDKSQEPAKARLGAVLRALPQRLLRVLLHNLPWKILSLVLAVTLWAGLITQDPTLTRERTFADVPVTITGADTLQRNGLVVLTDISEQLESVRLRVDVPQREYNTVSAANYSPRIDLTRITEAGAQTLKVATTSSATYGTVKEVTPDSVDVMVDEYITSYRVPVSIQRTGQFPKGYYGTAPTLDPSSVTISGPKSVVEKIARVMVDFDASRLPAQTGSIRTAVPMRFTDTEGNPVESSLIDVTSGGVWLRSIIVEQQLYATKTLPLSSLSLTTGIPKEGYEVRSITATPSIVVGAGDETALDYLDALFVEQAVDVTGVEEPFTGEVRIRKPTELIYLSSDSVVLSIEIAPVITTRTLEGVPLSVVDSMEGRQVESQVNTVSIILSGPEIVLSSLSPASLHAYAEAGGLDAGPQEVTVALKMDGIDESKLTYEVIPKTVVVDIVDSTEE